MKITPFVASDYKTIVDGGWCIGDPNDIGEIFANKGPAFTARAGDDIIACAGVTLFWPGVGEAWAVFSHLAAVHPFVHRHVIQGLHKVIQHYKLFRVQATVREGFVQGERWIHMLGFKFESRMRFFGPKGETFTRYVLFTNFTPQAVPVRLVNHA